MNNSTSKLFNILSNKCCGIFPAPMDANDALEILSDYLLGDDFYTASPLPQSQANVDIVVSILEKYSKEFIRDRKNFLKLQDELNEEN